MSITIQPLSGVVLLVVVAKFLLLLVPGVLMASSFDGKLFFTSDERTEMDSLSHSSETSEVLSNRRSNVASTPPLVSFDGKMGTPARPRLWINKSLWSENTLIPGVESIQWLIVEERLLVTLNSGRSFKLAIGQCLMPHYQVVSCV